MFDINTCSKFDLIAWRLYNFFGKTKSTHSLPTALDILRDGTDIEESAVIGLLHKMGFKFNTKSGEIYADVRLPRMHDDHYGATDQIDSDVSQVFRGRKCAHCDEYLTNNVYTSDDISLDGDTWDSLMDSLTLYCSADCAQNEVGGSDND